VYKLLNLSFKINVTFIVLNHHKQKSYKKRIITTMDMIIDFPGGVRVDAHYGPFDIMTDQPPSGGGNGEAPTPFSLFLASIGTCAGIYVLGFCQQRNLPSEGIRIVQRMHRSMQTGLIGQVDIEIQVPPTFPEKYRDSLIRSAQLCAVKKHLENPPVFEVTTKVLESIAA
jgi:ribosomal protein S12 methylthiotransferase accessory factor